MSVTFAAARTPARSPVARALLRRAIPLAANDQPDEASDRDALHAALRHFALHGMGSAQAAFRAAENALSVGDTANFDRWHGVCQVLDRRLASTLLCASSRGD